MRQMHSGLSTKQAMHLARLMIILNVSQTHLSSANSATILM